MKLLELLRPAGYTAGQGVSRVDELMGRLSAEANALAQLIEVWPEILVVAKGIDSTVVTDYVSRHAERHCEEIATAALEITKTIKRTKP